VGVGTAAISQLTATALKPVAVLMATADEIAASHDFARRVGLTGDPEDELVALSTTFDTMLASLESAYRQQQRFLGDVSHELRTPLAVIHGNAQLLTDGGADGVAMSESATHILRESERLARLVDKLLVLARADAAEPFAPAPVHVDEIVMETFEEMRPIAGARLRVPWIDAVIVDGERDRLKQLLVVLLDNALRYTPAPGTVDLTVSDDGHDAVIRVEDRGIGLPNVPTDRLFERSYRGPAAKVADPTGSGLGLSIARWIVARHGGAILIEPNDGGGTRVVVRLPRHERGARRPEPEEITVAPGALAPAE
jgi:two-component system OmpR family sensor kinase